MFSFCSLVKRRVANGPRTDLQRIASVNKGLCGLRAGSEFAPAGGQEQQKQGSLGSVFGCRPEVLPPLHDDFSGAVHRPATATGCVPHSNIAGSRPDFSTTALIQLKSWNFELPSDEAVRTLRFRQATIPDDITDLHQAWRARRANVS